MNDSDQIEKPWIEVLSLAEIEKIHEKTLDVLQNTGIEVNHVAALEMLQEAGADTDFDSMRARIPADLVTQCLETVPREVLLAARNSDKDCHLKPGGRPYSRNGGGSDYTLDLETDEFRPLLRSDVEDYVRLMDGLDYIDFIAPVYGHDLPIIGRDVLVMRELLFNTNKHIHMRAYSKASLQCILNLTEAIAGSKEQLKERPILSLLEAPISPLKFLDITVDALLLCGEFGIPLEFCVMPISGGTGPMTLSGNVLLFNAEFLGGMVISQLANPAAPIIYSPRPMIMDMGTGIGLTGSIEASLMSAVGGQLAHYYNVPLSLHGPWTDSMLADGQSTFERTYFAFISAFAGANILAGAGMIQQGLTFSHVQLVIDDEIHGTILRTLQGIDVDEERLGADAIDRVGPGGNFMMDDHTLKFLRGERYLPHLLFRQSRDVWEERGSERFMERARDRAISILEEHQPDPLPEDKMKMVETLVEEGLKTLA